MLHELITRHPTLAPLRDTIEAAVTLLYDSCRAGGKLLVCGNGGSCADADHMVGELMKGFLKKRPLTTAQIDALAQVCDAPHAFASGLQGAIPAISLGAQSAVLTAYANDVDATMMYAQLAYGYAAHGDVLIAISTSGNSPSIVNAAIAAKAKGARVLALTGASDSRLSATSDITIRAPEQQTYKVQELHLPIYHCLCAALEQRLFDE